MSKLPTLFVSHGSPMLALDAGATGLAWRDLAASLPKPRAILVVSAHWMTARPMLSSVAVPETIHDFGGFPSPLYEIQYQTVGAPALAEQIAKRLQTAGLAAGLDTVRGLDHGAWVPLREMYPAGDVPAFQLSLQGQGAAYHYKLGLALAGLADDGILVLGSGGLTHNLREVRFAAGDDEQVAPYVTAFAQWMHERLLDGRIDDLLDYRRLAPEAARAHPSEEHLLPLFVALGAAGPQAAVARVHGGVSLGVLSMAAYRFGG